MNVKILENEPLNRHSSYSTGGNALYFTMPEDIGGLKEVLIWADALKLPHEIIGSGSNILFSDEGYNGLIISLSAFENWIVRRGISIVAGAGAKLNDVVKYACDNNLKGLECLAGIPGTVGGAVKMNAGAYATEIKDVVSRISILSASGELQNIEFSQELIYAAQAEFGYRESKGLLGKIVLVAEFELLPGDGCLNDVRREILSKRASKQPLHMPSCGSVFKRPLNGYAGALIESCGLKGFSIGGAQVSEKHANFILNTGHATSSDIYKLIKYVQKEVFLKHKIILHEEVRYIGNFNNENKP